MGTVLYLAICAIAALVALLVGCFALVLAAQLAYAAILLVFSFIIAMAKLANWLACGLVRVVTWPIRKVLRRC